MIELLNHGHVRLVDHMGNDLSVVRSARVSYDADWRAGDDAGKDAKLIHYLMKNKHTSPFESVTFTFEVKAPIFVFRQWHRHRTWAFNEISARYAELPEEFYVPEPGMYGQQSKNNKQQRVVMPAADFGIDAETYGKEERWAIEQRVSNEACFAMYRRHIEEGMPRELARTILPFATYSKMFATVNLHNLLGFLRLRNHSHAQYEIQVYAQAMFKLIEPVVPVCCEAFMTN